MTDRQGGTAMVSEGGTVVPLHDTTKERAEVSFCDALEGGGRGAERWSVVAVDVCWFETRKAYFQVLYLGRPQYGELLLGLS